MKTNGYWSPSTQTRFMSLWEVRQAFPNVSLPENMDIPEIGVVQVHLPEIEVPEDQCIEWVEPPVLTEADNRYYQDYKLNPIPPEEV